MVPKLTIYVPDDLAAEVRAAGLNVSQVAQVALRAELGRRPSIRPTEVPDVVARLRTTRDKEGRQTELRWHDLGARWAKEEASVAELGDMDEMGFAWVSWRVPEDHSIRRFLAAEENWDPDFRADVERSEAIVAFIEGAVDVWQQVWPLLDAEV